MRYVKRRRDLPKTKLKLECYNCGAHEVEKQNMARELALCWRQATSWQGEARHQLERVLAELDPAWMTLV